MIQADAIIGVWKMRSFVSEDIETKALERPLGDHPNGQIIFTRGGYMSAIGVASNRTPLNATSPTDVERVALFKSLFAYSGKYRLDGDKVLHDVEASWREDWTGTTQIRFAETNADVLTVKTAPFRNPRDGRQCVVTATWDRVE